MSPDEAFEFLESALSGKERAALDVMMTAVRAVRDVRVDLDVRGLARAATVEGDSFTCDVEWLGRFAALAMSREREACAQLLEVSSSGLRLMAGEMTQQEIRTTQAILKCKAAQVRGRTTQVESKQVRLIASTS